jgi:hypothetical protein
VIENFPLFNQFKPVLYFMEKLKHFIIMFVHVLNVKALDLERLVFSEKQIFLNKTLVCHSTYIKIACIISNTLKESKV